MTFLRKEGQYWKIYYYLNGKKRKISTRTPSKTLAEQIKIKFINDLAARKFNMEPAALSRITMKEFSAEAEEHSRVNKSPNTVIREKYCLNLFRKYIGEDTLLKNISVRSIEEYKIWLSPGHSPAGINANLRHLSSAFSLAMRLGYISENPFRRIKLVPEPKKYPVFLTRDQANNLLASTEGQHIHQFIIIALFTGCRVSEICNLKWVNVNLDQGYIHVTGKGNKERQIPLPNRLINYLKEKPKTGAHVVYGSRCIIYIAQEFKKTSAGKEGFRFHDLRHTYASWLAQAGESIQAIKELLGHSSIQTTMIYAHLSQKTLINAVRSLDL